MKVKELIKVLKDFDPDSLVVTGGFDEEGFADIVRIETVKIKKRKSKHSAEILGEYEQSQTSKSKAILIDHY